MVLSLMRLPDENLARQVVFMSSSFFIRFLFRAFQPSHFVYFGFWINGQCGCVRLVKILKIGSRIASFGVRMLRIEQQEVFIIRFVEHFIVFHASFHFWVLWIQNLKLGILPLRSPQKVIEVWLKKRAIRSPDDEYIAFGSFKGELSVHQQDYRSVFRLEHRTSGPRHRTTGSTPE